MNGWTESYAVWTVTSPLLAEATDGGEIDAMNGDAIPGIAAGGGDAAGLPAAAVRSIVIDTLFLRGLPRFFLIAVVLGTIFVVIDCCATDDGGLRGRPRPRLMMTTPSPPLPPTLTDGLICLSNSFVNNSEIDIIVVSAASYPSKIVGFLSAEQNTGRDAECNNNKLTRKVGFDGSNHNQS